MRATGTQNTSSLTAHFWSGVYQNMALYTLNDY